jgi:hypothetical protein
MTTQIQQELHHFERQHNIKILYAVESGSRAWGVASPDSDWDVRYIYIHQLDWYLQIDDKKDNQDEILNDYLVQKIAYFDEYAKSLHPHIQPDTALLNEFFVRSLHEAWG